MTRLSLSFVATLLLSVSPPMVAGPKVHPLTLEDFVAVDTSRLMGSPAPLPALELELAYPNLKFQRPVFLTHAGDGSDRVFVGAQDGVIHVFPNHRDVVEPQVFLDIRSKVSRDHNEEGLLGLAFHPRYRENGEFFVYYSVKPRASVIARLRVSTADLDLADASSEELVMRIPQPFGNHNGGPIEFGRDGFLYIGLGDGGGANDPHGNGQNLATLLGSILRIDVDGHGSGRGYAIPPDNPFVGLGGEVRGEIWAYGIRNAWRLTFDRQTGDLWIGDVGQNIWEEVDVVVRGGNYGWKAREGMHPFVAEAARAGTKLRDPAWEYHHSEGKSVTGGYVYRGNRLPELVGWYLCADFVSGNIWALEWDGERVTAGHDIARSRHPVSAFGEDQGGEVYLCAFDGRVYRLRRSAEKADSYPSFPTKLSGTGLFRSVKDLEPAPGLIPYSVAVPLWSDGAAKERYIALPEKGEVVFREKGNWEFPVGTVFVKTFLLEMVDGDPRSRRRLETRLLIRNPREWEGYTYVWNDDQTDAELIHSSLRKTFRVETADGAVRREWYFPSHTDCHTCHTEVAGSVLGFRTRQLNHHLDYSGERRNQLELLDRLGVFAKPLPANPEALEAFPEWGSPAAADQQLARAYLDVNCAMCHAPGGTGNSKMDLRYHTPLDRAFLLGQDAGQGRLGGRGSKLILPGEPERSELILRMRRRGPQQMPIVASNRVDEEVLEVLARWIAGLPEE